MCFLLQDNIQKGLLSLAVAMETTHRPFRRRQLLQSYALFVNLVSEQLGKELEEVTPFIVMDIIHTIVRLLNHEMKRMETSSGEESNVVRVGGVIDGKDGGANAVREVGANVMKEGGVEEKTVSLCFHILTKLARAALEFCPEVCVCVCVCMRACVRVCV